MVILVYKIHCTGWLTGFGEREFPFSSVCRESERSLVGAPLLSIHIHLHCIPLYKHSKCIIGPKTLGEKRRNPPDAHGLNPFPIYAKFEFKL